MPPRPSWIRSAAATASRDVAVRRRSRRRSLRPLLDFAGWSEYVDDFPPVLLVRVTPKMVESFWTTVARGAARTQGMAIPPIKHFKSGFARLRAYCGDAEVLPIHPFKLEQRISETDAINEGLYVFDPGALGPSCGSVKLVLFSEKEPDKADSRVVDPKIVQQIWDDFASYRALGTAPDHAEIYAGVHSAGAWAPTRDGHDRATLVERVC